MNIVRNTINKVNRLNRSLKVLLSSKKYDSKVFCIGYNKTGTTTLGKSLKLLGYSHSSFNRKVYRRYYLKGNIDKVLNYTARFEAFDDLPWLKEDMIPILDNTFPRSKFIYLTREEEAWKKSFYNWTYKVTGGYPDVNKGWNAYKKHETFVFEYFKGRPKEDFISLDVTDPQGFKKLATFLGKPKIQDHFPHFNRTKKY